MRLLFAGLALAWGAATASAQAINPEVVFGRDRSSACAWQAVHPGEGSDLSLTHAPAAPLRRQRVV
jgi:hypothetical protein